MLFMRMISAMNTFLDSSERLEKKLLITVGNQTRKVLDDLLPQMRLAAYENEGAAIVDMRIGFEFTKDGDRVAIACEGQVQFPAKRSYAESVCE